jgi:hypothetical protein
MTYTYCDCDVEEAMFDVGSKRSQIEEKILNLRTENLCKLQIKKEQLLMIKTAPKPV